jgi:nitrogen-specific signal transduction histidine kinase
MLSRYKEIWYGVLIGLSTFILDVMMHASMHGQLNLWSFINELFLVDVTQLFFRSLFVLVSIAFGFTLWRSNQHKNQMQDLQTGIETLHKQIMNPLVLIIGYSQLLSLKEGWPATQENIELVNAIRSNAEKINELIKQMPPPGQPLSVQLKELSVSENNYL